MPLSRIFLEMDKINVIYIAPIGYSGSTLMDRILGSYEGLQNIGEAKFFDEWVENDLKCSCSKKMSECDFWGEFIAKYPDFRIGQSKGNYKLNLLYRKPKDFIHKSMSVGKKTHFLYDYILKKTGKQAIVDSSKNIGRLAMLAQSGFFNVKVIQMIRNGKDVCASMKIEKYRPSFEDQRKTKKQSFWKSAIKWRLTHANLSKLSKEYSLPLLPVHLESLTDEDQLPGIISRVNSFLDMGHTETGINKKSHTISGSHWRVMDGNTIISKGVRDGYKISLMDKLIFNLIAGRMNRNFGYK